MYKNQLFFKMTVFDYLTNRTWFSMVCTVIDGTRHHSGQNGPQQILTTVMTRIVVNRSTDHAKPHCICFLPQHQS